MFLSDDRAMHIDLTGGRDVVQQENQPNQKQLKSERILPCEETYQNKAFLQGKLREWMFYSTCKLLLNSG